MRFPKKPLYERVSIAKKFRASDIEADEVALLFNPEFLNIPSETCRIGNKIYGSSADEILEEIMKQMGPAGFQIKKADHFNRIYHDHVSEFNQRFLKRAVVFMNDMLKDFDIDGNEPAEQINAFKQAADNMKKYYHEHQDEDERPVLNLNKDMRRLFDELAGAPSVFTSPHSSSLHKALSMFWLQLLKNVTLYSAVDKSDSKRTEIEFRENGASRFTFEMEVSDAFLRSHCKTDVPPLGPKGDASSSDGKTTRITKKSIVADPDLSGFRLVSSKKDEKKKSDRIVKLFLIAEFKGQMAEIKEELSKSGKSDSSTFVSPTGSLHGDKSAVKDVQSTSKRKSSRLSDGGSKRIKLSEPHGNKDEELHTHGISRQHFLELLCAIKYQMIEYESGVINKCYGLYCVKHRFYITCLAVVDRAGNDDDHNDVAKALFICKANTPERFHGKKLKLRMVCTDYLDLTNPVHMEAALKFISCLASCEDYI